MEDGARMHESLRATIERLCGAVEGGRFERRDGYDWIVFPQIPIPQFNSVWPVADEAAPSLGPALAEIAELGLPSSLQVRRGRTPAFEQEARRLGLTDEAPMPGMVVTPDALRAPELPELEVVRVATADGLAQALAVASAGFGMPADLLAPLFLLEVAALEGFVFYLGRVDGRDVSTSIGYTLGGTVGIFNVATPPEHRGRGYGAAMTAAAAREGFAAGADLAWLQSSAMGLSVYRRLGFRGVEEYVLLTKPSPDG